MTWRPDQPIVWEEKTTAPGVTDDENNNYLVGDLWIDETHDLVYICVDDVAGAAVWTNVVGTGSAPSFTTVKLTDLTDGYIPYHVNDATGLANGPTKANVDSAISLMHAEVHTQGVAYGGTNLTSYAVGDLLYASAITTLAKLADVAAGSYLRSGGITTAPLWSTLILPNAATAFRLPVATSVNTIGELAASGATGEYLAGATGAIPAWATLNQAAVAGLTTVSSPAFATVKLSDLTDGYIPYHINDATGLANGPTKADVDDAVSKKHAEVHTQDVAHGGTGLTSYTAGDMLQATGATTLTALAKGTRMQNLRMNDGATAFEWGTARELITAARTYYVRADGNDANTGLVDSSAGAKLTLQAMYNLIAGPTLDFGGQIVTIKVGAGTYTAGVLAASSWQGGGKLVFEGDITTPSNVHINVTGQYIFTNSASLGYSVIKGFKFTSASPYSQIYCENSILLELYANEYASSGASHILANGPSVYIDVPIGSSYTISGGGTSHWTTNNGGFIRARGSTITLTGTPAFSTAFAYAQKNSSQMVTSNTFSGAATGLRYSAIQNGVIVTNGAGATYLPGDTGGTTDGFGAYF